MYDLNDAQPQLPPVGELIPDGTFAKVRMTIRPGGVNGSTPMDAGLLKASHTSDAKMLDCEFTVVAGAYARRKFWQNFTVAGGKVDEKGQSKGWNISKSAFRAMVDSAIGLDPKDESPDRKAKARDPGVEATRRYRVCRSRHSRADVEPAIQGRPTSSPTWLCRASRNTQPSCAARTCRPSRSTPNARKAPDAAKPLAPAWGAPNPPPAPTGVPWAKRRSQMPRLRPLPRPVRPGSIPEAAAHDRRRVAGPCHA